MSDNEFDDERNYEVGKGKPPKEFQFQKGQSGNPKGRPKSKNTDRVDISGILNKPVQATIGGRKKTMSTFEVSFRQLAKRAIDGHFPSIRQFLKICIEYDVIATLPQEEEGGVITVPADVDDSDAWLASEYGLVRDDGV